MLDKSKNKALGTNTTQSFNLSSWSKSSLVISTTPEGFITSGSGGVAASIGLTSGKVYFYRISYEIDNSDISIYNNNAATVAELIASSQVKKGELSGIFIALKSGIYIRIGGAGSLIIKSMNIQEIVGNHAYQSASASRPILQQTPALGVNVLQNPDFTSQPTVGVGTTTTTNSFNVVGSAGGVRFVDVFEVGKLYKINAKFTTTASNLSLVNAGGGTAPLIASSSSGVIDTIYTATSSSLYLRAGVGTTTVTELEIKEVIGYRTDQNYLVFDGVDDKLTTTLPAQLTGCTVIRSVPNVGTQILTNQTIPTPYDDNIDNYGLIVINRALTTSETAQITKLFNKSAGV